ncbi:MAG TPA: 16S rRNA (adenine(1518)-N(6)/adenine(1519)-N(6))-dimethyltransferase RsmA [Candidatus Atribacteria bacterium]|nr:16S rRNA (adenine(1518)-N(6)/adenine(1519)-N(6))-dimethyltransferase RsmA [Candidatus Atribacteria bacterium]HPT78531.1 16S rRNA (adenine(1518)-N(6)/adenine(1519)-N(6))-dimethyltransferase RsmA [Candidatus Atribacteria bacterium]
MQSLTSPRYLKELLERHGFHFSKSLGQNFLIDRNILNKIIEGARVTSSDYCLEVGPGVGTLTRALAEKAAFVAAVEIDKRLLPVLEETLEGLDNVRVIHGDILKLDIGRLAADVFSGSPFKVVANLPYYITTPIIMRFLEEDLPFTTIVIMVQKEVAERMSAAPGTKDYGALTVAVQYYTRPRIVARAPASVFMPPPKVDSVVIALERRDEPPVMVKDKAGFFRMISALFSQRRKTLLNTLLASGLTDLGKEDLTHRLASAGIDPRRRAETLSLEELARLYNSIA